MKDHKRVYLSFKQEGVSKSGKTQIWIVYNRNEDLLLGNVCWNTGWRKYVFEPEIATFYDDECLKEISSFLTDLNYVYKKQRESKLDGGSK